MADLKGVLLDVDGTLVDSNDAHAKAWLRAFAEVGRQIHFARVRRLIGKGGDKLLPEITGIPADSPQGQAIIERRARIFQKDFLPNLRPFAGIRELLQRMLRRGLRLAVASSSTKEELQELLRICEAEDLIEKQTSSDDADESKPAADIVEAALAKLQLDADQAILLGDSPYDVEAAGKAGVKAVALRCGGWKDAELTGAIAIYDDPAQLLDRFDESPFANRV